MLPLNPASASKPLGRLGTAHRNTYLPAAGAGMERGWSNAPTTEVICETDSLQRGTQGAQVDHRRVSCHSRLRNRALQGGTEQEIGVRCATVLSL